MDVPVFWINLERDKLRRKRMQKAIERGAWNGFRFNAIDAFDNSAQIIALARFWQKASVFPGALLSSEASPSRVTSRSELACLCSWQLLIESLTSKMLKSNWVLLMEDDIGSSLAVVKEWPINLDDLIRQAGEHALAIQMAPINGHIRRKLYSDWICSNKKKLLVPKSSIKSHGNGAVLLNKKAIPILSRRLGRIINNILPNLHLIGHPRNVRPVADKWLYSSLPNNSCFVTTFPFFCLEAQTSSIHKSHVSSFHKASRDATLKIWNEGRFESLLKADRDWFKTNI